MNKIFFYLLLVVGLVALGTPGCEENRKSVAKVEKSPKIEEVRPLRNVIHIEAEGDILHYQRESFWNSEDFFNLLESKENFTTNEIDSFKKTLEGYDRHAISSEIRFNQSKQSVILTCDIKGAKEGDWFDFDWLLRPYSLDFIDSNFESKERELSWEGKIQGVETVISLRFPYSISNCHEHVWPAR